MTHFEEDVIIARALGILSNRLRQPGVAITSNTDAVKYLNLLLAQEEREVFGVMYLDAQHCLICDKVMFYGTLTMSTVYPREVLKTSLAINAAAVILYHNHPSGNTEPSESDVQITNGLKAGLLFADVKLLDHIIIGGVKSYSFAESGRL